MAKTSLMRIVPLALIATALPGMEAGLFAQDTAEARMRQMMECDAIKSESVRLSCYDSVVRRGRTALGANRPGMVPGQSAAQPRTPQQAFGMNPKIERDRGMAPTNTGADEITARVASATERGAGLWRVTFADGARWDFTEGQRNFQPPARGDEVRIRRSALGGYLMYVGKQPSIRVARSY